MYLKIPSDSRIDKFRFFVHVSQCIEVSFETYMYIFILYLITRFARASKSADMKDAILQKEVPSVVFILN